MRLIWSVFALSACAGGVSFSADDLAEADPSDLAPSSDLASDPRSDLAGSPDLAAADLQPSVDLSSRDLASSDLATVPGVFVAVGYGGRRVRSTDTGQSWTDDQADVPGDNNDDQYLIRDVGWGHGAWLTAGGFNGWTWTSSDGKTWTGKNDIGQWFGNVVYGKGLWVAAGGYGRRASSTDGVTWIDNYDDGHQAYRKLIFGEYMGGRFVAIGDSGRTAYSTNGTDWTLASGVPTTNGYNLMAYGNGVFVAAEGTNFVRSSDGGATWTAGTLPASLDGITFGAGQFLAVGSGAVMTSSDGAQWSQKAVAGLGGSVAFGNGSFVAVNGGKTWLSTDGASWTSKNNFPSGSYISSVRFGGTP